MTTGEARVSETYPSGGPLPRKNGCWDLSVAVIPDDGTRCYTVNDTGDADAPVTEDKQPAQVITGVLERDPKYGTMGDTVLLYPDTDFSATAGKRTYFALPAIGTTYLPEDFRAKLPVDVGADKKAYVPGALAMMVSYRELDQKDRVESVAPEPLPGELSWIGTDSRLLRPRGSFVDTVLEENAQRDLFLIGVYTGVAPTVAFALVSFLWKEFRGIRHGRVTAKTGA